MAATLPTPTDTHGDPLPYGWSHWPGQLTLHPTTQVLPYLDPVCGILAWRWGLVAVTVGGESWWYGYAPMDRDGQVAVGWWLVPRDPVTDPGPLELEVHDGP